MKRKRTVKVLVIDVTKQTVQMADWNPDDMDQIYKWVGTKMLDHASGPVRDGKRGRRVCLRRFGAPPGSRLVLTGKGSIVINHLQFLRDGFAVRRFHTVVVHKEQTVGEHSINVAAIACYLYGEWDKDLMMAAIFHDSAEQFLGDIPAPAKWENKSLAEAMDEAEQRVFQECQIPVIKLSEKQLDCLKAADMLELMWKCAEEMKLGNGCLRLVFRRGQEYLRRYEETIPRVKEIMGEIQWQLMNDR